MVFSRASSKSSSIKLNMRQRSSDSRQSVQKKFRREDCSEVLLRNECCPDVEEAGDENVMESDYTSESKIYMACIMQGHRLGAAYFDVSTREMFVIEAWEELEEEFPLVQLIREDGPSFHVKLVKSSVFSLQQARHRLAYLQVKGMASDLNHTERAHVLNSMINLENDMQVRAAGGLLAVLQQELLIDMEPGSHSSERLQIEAISELSLEGILFMDAATHEALQIFQVETHASAMGIGKAKEGFSVYGMLNKCVTLMGRQLLRLWFLRPIVDLDILNDRLDSIQLLMAAVEMIEALQACLRNVKDVPRLLKKILSPTAVSTSKDWFTLVQIRGILEVGTTQRHHFQKALLQLQIVAKISAFISDDLLRVSDLVSSISSLSLINGVLDFDQICGENCDTMIAYGLCEELDELKRLYEGLPDFLHQVTSSEQWRIPPECEGSTVYIPQVGFFMCFINSKLCKEKLESLPDFEFAFEGSTEEDQIFYRTSKTRELDDDLGDIYHKILDMERAILRNLEMRVQQYSECLNQAAKVAAEVDCILALTLAAREYKYVRPNLTNENILAIKNGRHVLQEMTIDRFVPNDTDFGNTGRVCIITGPNYSGKSIYAKQVVLYSPDIPQDAEFLRVALIVFLAHIGSFVPADQAVVGLTDRIFTRIVSKETTAVAQSTFMIDLNQIAVMLRHSTCRSLCIIDEFGKGTLTEDGIGLLCATLNHFASQESPPKVMAITHFTEVSDNELLPESSQIAFHTMSILGAEETENHNPLEEIVFLYRLVPGYAAPSYGIHCAELASEKSPHLSCCSVYMLEGYTDMRRLRWPMTNNGCNGLPLEVIDRSKEVLQLILSGNPIRRLENPSRLAKDQLCQVLAAKLLAFDCKEGDVEAFMRDICVND